MTAWAPATRPESTALGRGGLATGAFSFGAAPLGNLGVAVSDEVAFAAVDAAWAAGIRYFDVSPHYGIGLAERRLGEALRQYPRDQYVLSTKVGRRLLDLGEGVKPDRQGFAVESSLARVFDYSADGTERSIVESLERMGLDRVDIVYVHDAETRPSDAFAGAFPALESLRRQGVISSYGAGMNSSPGLVEVVRNTDADVILAARTWVLTDQSALVELLPLALERDVSVVVGGVFWGLGRPGSKTFVPPAITRLCREVGVDPLAAALRFPLTHPAVHTVLVGMQTPEQVVADLAAARADIPAEFWVRLRDVLGLD